MAKRKQRLSLNPDMMRVVGLVLIFVLGTALAVMALVASLRHVCASSLFTVRDVVIADSIQPLDLPELAKLKGQNLFAVDLSRVEARIRDRYPQLAHLHVLRQFPDHIFVTAIRREPFARVSLDGRTCVIDRDGYMIGTSLEGTESLTLIKGLKRQRISPGDAVRDERVDLGVRIIAFFHQDRHLSSVRLEEVNLDDLTRIVCDLVIEQAGFQVVVDKDNMASGLKTFSEMVSRGGLDFQQIKYMDLRFAKPILGQKKVRK